MYQPLPLPPFYDSKNAENPLYRPDAELLVTTAAEWRRRHNLKDAATDAHHVEVLVVDDQVDFCYPPPDGSLFVGGRSGRGAIDDVDRTARFLNTNLGIVTHVTATLDTHSIYQVFSSVAHVDRHGEFAPPHTVITHADYLSGKWRANPAMAAQLGVDPNWLTRQWTHYCKELEAAGRDPLYIWPVHCILGDRGHTLAGVVEEARRFHGYVRGSTNVLEVKGGNPLTENYSIFRPEVMTRWDGGPIPGAQRNVQLIDRFERAAAVIVVGEAGSHCVPWTVQDMTDELFARNPSYLAKLYVVQDCTSAVVVPGVVDFTDAMNAKFNEFRDRGVNIVNSTDPIASWPGIAGQIADKHR